MTKQKLLYEINTRIKYLNKFLNNISEIKTNLTEDIFKDLVNKVIDTHEMLRESLTTEEYEKFFFRINGQCCIKGPERHIFQTKDFISALELLTNKLKRGAVNVVLKNDQRLSSDEHKKDDLKKVFISYASQDKKIAGLLKQYLENKAFDVFVAHDDTKQGDHWEENLLKELSKMDVFIPIYSKAFIESEWTIQECGAALMKTDNIYPISLDGTILNGFIKKYQAKKMNEKVPTNTFDEMLYQMKEKQNPNWRNRLISKIYNIESQKKADELLSFLLSFKFDEVSINRLFQNCFSNSKIRGSINAKMIIRQLLNEYHNFIDDNLGFKILEKFWKIGRVPEGKSWGYALLLVNLSSGIPVKKVKLINTTQEDFE